MVTGTVNPNLQSINKAGFEFGNESPIAVVQCIRAPSGIPGLQSLVFVSQLFGVVHSTPGFGYIQFILVIQRDKEILRSKTTEKVQLLFRILWHLCF